MTYQHQHAPLPVQKLEDVPQPVVVLLEVLLKKDPERRFQKPAEFLDVLPIVRGAIAVGRPILKAVRIYISTGGDTQKERNLADGVIRAIGAEFDLPVNDSQLKPQQLVEHYPDSAVVFAVVSYRQYGRAQRAKISADQAAQRVTRARMRQRS